MVRSMDLVIRSGISRCSFGLCLGRDWLVRREYGTADGLSLSQRLSSFLQEKRELFDSIGKVVLVSDAAERFEQQISDHPKRIGYLRIGQDEHEHTVMKQRLAENGGLLDTVYLRPSERCSRAELQQVIHRFLAAGISDIAVNSAFQLAESDQEDLLISMIERMAPGQFHVHQLKRFEYVSFLLTENRLLVNVCIRDALLEELSLIRQALSSFGVRAQVMVLTGEGFCMDADEALRDPLISWQGEHAAALIGAAALTEMPDAVVISPYLSENGVIIDRVKAGKPVAIGRTKRYFGLQVAGPFVRALEFPGQTPRQRILESIGSMLSEPGPLPLLDLSGDRIALQDLTFPVLKVRDIDSAILTGMQSARFRKDFFCMSPTDADHQYIHAQMTEEAFHYLEAKGISLSESSKEFTTAATRYLHTEKERVRMILSGSLST